VNEINEPTPKPQSIGCLKLSGCLFVPLVIFLAITGAGWILHIFYSFVLGWFSFISGNLQSISWNGEMIACGTVALALATYGLHRIAIWIRKDKPWLWKWTLSLVSLTLFLFASSIAMTGIIHQTVWLMKSPIIENNHYGLTRAIAYQKQLSIGLSEYQAEHGKYPDNLEQLRTLASCANLSESLLHDQSREGWQPWIYFGHYHNTHPEELATQSLPLTMSPTLHNEKYAILLADGAVKSYSKESLLEKFPKLIDFLPQLLD